MKVICKSFILGAALALLMSFGAFAAGQASFPFEADTDADPVWRLCYAGHSPGGAIDYRDGLAITPETMFRLTREHGKTLPYEASEIQADISLLYENAANSCSVRELVLSYERGDLREDEYYDIFTDNLRQVLAMRDRLYSNGNSSLEIRLTYRSETGRREIKTYYYQVLPQDRYVDLYAEQHEQEVAASVEAENLISDEPGGL